MRTGRATVIAVSLGLYGTALGCGNDPRPKAEPAPEPEAAKRESQPEAKPAPTPDPSADELPLPQDFEAEVAAQITSSNFREELDRLERELAEQQR
jgi:hypothetical protein